MKQFVFIRHRLLILGLLWAGTGLAAHGAAPANDNFSARQNLGSAAAVSVAGNNTGATLEASEPDFGGIAASSVWYQWTAPATGWVNLAALVPVEDTVLGVFTGASVSALTQIAFNDDAALPTPGFSDHMSSVTFHALSGTSYKISVSGYSDPDSFSISQSAFTLVLTSVTPGFSVSGLSLSPDSVTITNSPASMTLQVSVGTTLPEPVSFTVRLQPDLNPTRVWERTLTSADRISGTSANGVYQVAFTLARFLPDGTWRATVIAQDGQRETRWSYGGDTTSDDFAFPVAANPILNVVNTGLIDAQAPSLSSLSAAPTTVNAGSIAEAGRVIAFQLDLTDDLSGIATGSISMVSATLEEQVIGSFAAADRVSGDALDGVYEVNAVVPYGSPAGNYAIRVSVTDGALSTSVFSSVAGSGDAPLPALSASQITVTSTGGYPAWAFSQVFPSGQVGLAQDADGDGVSNLGEYAFNMNPSVSDVIPVSATGLSGLPRSMLVDSGAGAVLRIVFLRRKASSASGLTYTVQFGSGLTDIGTGAWSDALTEPVVTSIDSIWERVSVDDSVLNTGQRFGRVKLDYAQP